MQKSDLKQKLLQGVNRVEQSMKNIAKSKNVVVGIIDEGKFLAQIDIEEYIDILRKEGYEVDVVKTYTGIDPRKKPKKGEKIIKENLLSDFRMYRIFKNTKKTDVMQIELDFIKHASDIDKNYRQGFVAAKYRDLAESNEDSWYNTYKTILEEFSSKDADIVYAKEHWGELSVEDKKKFITETNKKYRNLICENPKDFVINWDEVKNIGGDAAYISQRLGKDKKSENEIVSDVYRYATPESWTRDPLDDFTSTLKNIIHENIHYGQDIGKTDMPKYLLDYNEEHYILPKDVPETEKMEFAVPAYFLQPLESEAKRVDVQIMKGILKKIGKDK
jgi:hypothetical protein